MPRPPQPGSACEAVMAIDGSGTVVAWNEGATDLFGWTRDEVLGKPLEATLLPRTAGPPFPAELGNADLTRSPQPLAARRMRSIARHRDGSSIPVEFSLTPVELSQQTFYTAFIRDLSEKPANPGGTEKRMIQRAIESRLVSQAMTSSLAAATFEEALQSCIALVCDVTGWRLGHAWLMENPHNPGRPESLVSSGVWQRGELTGGSSVWHPASAVRVRRGEGLPGRIWDTGEAAWSTDLQDHPVLTQFERLNLPMLRGAFGFPVVAGEDIVAVLEFFSVEALAPDPQLLLLVGSIGQQLGRVIERQRWEEERDRLAAIVDSTSDAIISYDMQSRILSWNRGAEQMYQHSAAEAIGRHARLLWPPEQTDWEPGVAEALKSGEPLRRVEGRRRRRNGTLLEVALTVSPVRNHSGEVVGFATIERDVTQANATRRTLEEREERLRLLLDSTGEGIYGIDVEGRCTFANQACAELLGYDSPDDLLGKKMHEVMHHSRPSGEPWPERECPILQALQSGERAFSDDETFFRSDGTTFPGEFWSYPIQRRGTVEGAVVVFDDTTIRRAAEYDRHRLAAIVDSSFDAIIGTSLDGRITSWNRGAEAMYGYTVDEAIGRPVSLIAPDGPSLAELVGEGQELRQFEARRRHRDGRTMDVSTTLSPICNFLGRMVGISAIERDITDRKRREQELEAARDQAQAANRAKSDFVANISHELRTPMNAIIGMVEMALRHSAQDSTLHDYLTTARDSAHLLLGLVDDLLDFSRMEGGHFEIESEPFDLRRTLDETMRTLSLRAHSRGLELICHVDPAVPDRLEGDERRLRQIVMNLVVNAIKFTPQGEVAVDVGIESQAGDEVQLRLSVRDTGIGISREDQERIFRPFTQVDASLTRERTGAGLGLTICRELVQKMGGRIWLESTPGRGTTFWCTPRFKVLPEPPTSTVISSPSWDGLKAMVVDDNATTRRTLQETLSHWGFAVETAANGREAIARISTARDRREPVDVLFVDALMPEIDGLTLVETLRDRGLLPPTTLLLSASADRELLGDRLQGLNVAAAIDKPISQSALFDTLSSVLEGPMSVDESFYAQAPAQPLDILVAEDTPPNQKVVKAILEHRGHHVRIASNGREAVQHATSEHYDVVLMDVQMPTMDGLQATAAIRKSEDPELAEVPIVALTAHAMRRDRDRCLAAGMNGYISKPIDADTLIQMVEELATRSPPRKRNSSRTLVPDRHPSRPPATPSADATGAMPESTTEQLINVPRALERMGGDQSLLCDMASFFVDDAPALLATLNDALRTGEADEALRAAHSLKGLCSNFDAVSAVNLALSVESAARARDLDTARTLAAQLESQIDQVIHQLRREILT